MVKGSETNERPMGRLPLSYRLSIDLTKEPVRPPSVRVSVEGRREERKLIDRRSLIRGGLMGVSDNDLIVERTLPMAMPPDWIVATRH